MLRPHRYSEGSHQGITCFYLTDLTLLGLNPFA